uniref:Probable RNA-binding protein EIF1AD n=1 Tax=Moina brachiata TaxID=675436 RepID=A0A4Y7NJI0_9CRUS|nr:EOG090X0KPP [Moina brachiata]SVE93399.1 EOG090X0KPP [Moina brachiata]
MSKATKRKHVTKEVMDDFILPDPNQKIVRIVGGRGNNLHEIATETGENYLVSMPTKFRKNVWIKRGDFVIIQPIEEGEKVRAEIANILFPEQIRYIKSQKLWPEGFNVTTTLETEKDREAQEMSEASSSDEDDIHVNTNRCLDGEDNDSQSNSSVSESESDKEQ